jgi:regulator of protease activity HflC (stomatin/prohibitin superfamily)
MNIGTALEALATLAWLAALGLVGFVVFNVARGQKFSGGAMLIIAAVAVAVVLTAASAGLVFLQADQYGVVISALVPTGYRTQPIGPGLHWIVPFAESVRPYSVAKQTYTMSSATGEGQVTGDDSVQARTKDGQLVYIDASVIYGIDATKLIQLHITWQDRYQDNLVRPTSRGIIRDMASQYGVEEIVSSKRAELEEQITTQLQQKMSDNNLILVDFVLRDIHFSDEYATAVEQKQIAEQQAQQAAYVVEQKKQEAEQARQVAQGQADAAVIAAKGSADARLIQAGAEAKALTLINDALAHNPDLLTYTYIQKLAPNVEVMYLPSGQPLLLPLPTPSASSTPTETTP